MPFADQLISSASIVDLAKILAKAHPRPSAWVATADSAAALGHLGLSSRARAVRDALLTDTGGDYTTIAEAARSALGDPELTGWMVWPVTEAVATAATATGDGRSFDDGLTLLAELTPRLTSEFAIRTFLNADLHRTLDTVRRWTGSDSPSVRRLASEGTRPKLPWARQVPALNANPGVTIDILDRLFQDDSDFVRRSVANHLNDTSRLDPAAAVAAATRWSAADQTPTTAWVVKHSMRTLVRQGNPQALGLIGFRGDRDSLRVTGPTVSTPHLDLGDELQFTASITNTAAEPVVLAVDYVIHHMKANGARSPHVFKLSKPTLQPGETLQITRRHPIRLITTRRYYSGEHHLELQVNGHRFGDAAFHLEVGPTAPEPSR